MRIIFTRIGCTLLTCDVYMCDLRHIYDPVLSSLKMEGIRFFFLLFLSAFFGGFDFSFLTDGGVSIQQPASLSSQHNSKANNFQS
jgi:hypothetical protein